MADGDMLAAIAQAKARRLRSQALRARIAVALLAIAAATTAGIAGALHAPQPSAAAAEQAPSLSIEEAIWEAADDDEDFPGLDWEHWLGVNPDIVGWVTIKGTGIDHPIVQAKVESPTFYLSHAIDGSVDAKGCVFLDAECEAGLESMHAVVYGHNWNGGLMFADLAQYADAGFAAEHGEVLLQTPTWKERLRVQCVEVANGTDSTNVIRFGSEEEMLEWYDARFGASTVQLVAEPVMGAQDERIYTFCTCADDASDKRVLVYAMPATKARAASREAASTA